MTINAKEGNMMNTFWNIFVLFIIVSIGVLVGCQKLQKELTPATISDEMITYAYGVSEPNKIDFGWFKSAADLDNVILKINAKHLDTKADLEYKITKDLQVFTRVAGQGEIYQKEAAETAKLIWGESGIVMLGLGALGGGVGIGALVNRLKNNSMYSEGEVQQKDIDWQKKLQDTVAELVKTHWTNTEVANEVAARVLSVCQALGVTDMNKINELIASEKAKAIAEV
jgi:uncharacterized membrane-anchored protein YhcB (DUF1043 family)